MHVGPQLSAGDEDSLFLSSLPAFPYPRRKLARGIFHLTQQIVNLIRDNPQGARIWEGALGTVEESVAIRCGAAPPVFLGDRGPT